MLTEAELRDFFLHLHQTCAVCRHRPEGKTEWACVNDRCILFLLRNIHNLSKTHKDIYRKFLAQGKVTPKPAEERKADYSYPTI